MVAFAPAAIEAFFKEADQSPVAMLNLIRFEPDGGRDRYLDYLRLAKPILARFGAEILFSGDGMAALTEGTDKGWDAIAVVQYPNRAAFQSMVADQDYQAAFKVGASAIADIVLQPMKHFNGLA